MDSMKTADNFGTIEKASIIVLIMSSWFMLMLNSTPEATKPSGYICFLFFPRGTLERFLFEIKKISFSKVSVFFLEYGMEDFMARVASFLAFLTLYNVCSVHRGMFSTSGGVQYIGG